VREDYRGCSRLAIVMPRFARAIALRSRPFDHDSGMIRNHPQDGAKVADRKAAFMGKRIYGFARVHRFVDGWFPPEAREAIVYLCHSTRAEAMDSLVVPHGAALGAGPPTVSQPPEDASRLSTQRAAQHADRPQQGARASARMSMGGSSRHDSSADRSAGRS
jgi:hypothetical protein